MPLTFLPTRILLDFERYLLIEPDVNDSTPYGHFFVSEQNCCLRVVSCVKMSLPVHLMWRGGGMDGELYVMNYYIITQVILAF